MTDMIKSGCDIKEIPNMKFYSVDTSRAESIIDGFVGSGIKYSAKYNDEKLTFSYSKNDEKKVQEILKKAKTDTADFIERIRKEDGNMEEYISLLPEIADVMGVSAQSLENRPAELRLFLARAYVDYWFCDKTTIQEELNRVTELGYYAQNEVEEAHQRQEASNNTPQARKDVHEQEQRLDNAAAVEREILHQQRENVVKEEKRTGFFSVAKLRAEAERIRRQNQQERQEQMRSERVKNP